MKLTRDENDTLAKAFVAARNVVPTRPHPMYANKQNVSKISLISWRQGTSIGRDCAEGYGLGDQIPARRDHGDDRRKVFRCGRGVEVQASRPRDDRFR